MTLHLHGRVNTRLTQLLSINKFGISHLQEKRRLNCRYYQSLHLQYLKTSWHPLSHKHFKAFLPTTRRSIMSDADYAAFLQKASQHHNNPAEAAMNQETYTYKTMDEGEKVPAEIAAILKKNVTFQSESDLPFVPVVLAWQDASSDLPDEGECSSRVDLWPEQLAKLIGHNDPHDAEELITIMDPSSWDPKADYEDVTSAVDAAVQNAPVMVYKVKSSADSTRVEYWVLGCCDNKLIGVKVQSIES